MAETARNHLTEAIGEMDSRRKIDFEIDEELRARAIDEYVEKTTASRDNSAKRMFSKTYKIIIGIMFAAILVGLLIPVMIMSATGQGIVASGFVLVFALAMLIITFVMVVILVSFSVSNNKKNQISDLSKDVSRTTYRIEDGYLIREYEGDKRKTKKYDLNKIYYPDKEGDIGTFEYKNETIEYIDFYEPSLYETLKEIKEESQK